MCSLDAFIANGILQRSAYMNQFTIFQNTWYTRKSKFDAANNISFIRQSFEAAAFA